MICRQAAELVTRSLDGPLPARAWVGLSVHTLFCSSCRRFQRQMRHLHRAFEATVAGSAEETADGRGDRAADGRGDGLSGPARQRIAAALSRAAEPG